MGDYMVLAGFGAVLLDGIRVLFSVIDSVVYFLMVITYNLLTTIAKVNIFDSGSGSFGTRVYTIMGVIMLFKLAFSIITYIVDPDKLSDSKAGMSNMIKNIMIMLVLVVTVPIIFKYATALQYLVLEDNTIGRLITGKDGGTKDNLGEDMAVAVLSGFVRINEDLSGVPDACKDTLRPSDVDTCKSFLSSIDSDMANDYATAFADVHGGYKYLLKAARSNAKVGDEYAITYNFILSTIVGGLCAYIFLLFCIDVAVRTVKLAFLQLIAPLPIASYIDAKGQQGTFKKWVDACIGTYLELFVRLAAIEFALYIISEFIMNTELQVCTWQFNGDSLSQGECTKAGVFVAIFLILGTLMFAKSLPKLIGDITGFKMDGLELNAMKKLAAVPLVGGAAAGAVGLAGRTGLNMVQGVGTMGGNWLKNTSLGKAANDKFTNAKNYMSSDQRWFNKAGTKIKGYGSAINEASGGAFGRIGEDFGDYGTRMKYAVGNAVGYSDYKLDRLESKEGKIIDSQRDEQAMINRRKQVIEANNKVFERAKKKVAESAEYAKRKMEAEALQEQYQQAITSHADEATINDLREKAVKATTTFNKWANKDGVYSYIDNEIKKVREDHEADADGVLINAIRNRNTIAASMSTADETFSFGEIGKGVDVFEYTNALGETKRGAEAFDDYVGALTAANSTAMAGLAGSSQSLTEIQEQEKALKKGIASGNEFLSLRGGKK